MKKNMPSQLRRKTKFSLAILIWKVNFFSQFCDDKSTKSVKKREILRKNRYQNTFLCASHSKLLDN